MRRQVRGGASEGVGVKTGMYVTDRRADVNNSESVGTERQAGGGRIYIQAGRRYDTGEKRDARLRA